MAGFMRGTMKNLEAYVTEISRAAADLSTGTTEQASAVEKLTATVETAAALADKPFSTQCFPEALSQIEAGIEQISGVTQNTAASTQESSAISEQLADKNL